VKRGLAVTVLEAAPRVLARVTAPALSDFYERVHREAGVESPDRRGWSAVSRQGWPRGICPLRKRRIVSADFVLIGIGLVPNTELAEGAGLNVDDGIVVDEASRTSDPDIYAIGDCVMHAHHGFLQRKIRLESVPNALEQARAVAASITGRPISSGNRALVLVRPI